ncbi:hypothetical protein [Peribacillus simplex]
MRVVGVAPGFIDTPIFGDNEEVKNALAAQHMRGSSSSRSKCQRSYVLV